MSKQPKLEAGQCWDNFRGFQIRIGCSKDGELLMLLGTSYICPLDEGIVLALIVELGMTQTTPFAAPTSHG